EFSRVLRVCARDGSVLSQIIRDAWDGRPLQIRSRSKTSIATEHHVAVLGHITVEELRLRLTDTDIYSGFANRFLWCCARRAHELPAGGNVPVQVIADHGRALVDAVNHAGQAGCLARSNAAAGVWAELYKEMATDDPGGLLGAAISRDAPQVLRLSLLYALLDAEDSIGVPHLLAAWAIWRYCRASAELIFGDLQGDTVADRLLAALRQAAPAGLTSREQFEALGGHVSAVRLAMARQLLEERGLIVTRTETTGGRPRTVSYASEQSE
ncbi:MAG TPA: hypothetical protein VLL25_20300, partial [Acidimicrobiales bacterium]|nr:hypothetical protein [Acidimicrobiales bacterium]